MLAQVTDFSRLIRCTEIECPDKNSDGRTDTGEFRLLKTSERTIAQQNGLDLSQVEVDRNNNGMVDDYEKVRIYRFPDNRVFFKRDDDGEIRPAVASMGRIYVRETIFEEEFTVLDDESLLVHELTHVFQQRSIIYAVRTGSDPEDYWYRSTNGSLTENSDGTQKSFENFGAEAQAEIMSDRHRLCHGGDPRVSRNENQMTREQMFNDLNSISGIPRIQTTCMF